MSDYSTQHDIWIACDALDCEFVARSARDRYGMKEYGNKHLCREHARIHNEGLACKAEYEHDLQLFLNPRMRDYREKLTAEFNAQRQVKPLIVMIAKVRPF